MIIIKNLNLTTDFLLVENICLKLDSASVIGLVGPNGSGKTTFMRTVAGLRNQSNGQAQLIMNDMVMSPKKVKKNIFYFESINWFNDSLSGLDYLNLICNQWGADRNLIPEIINFWDSSAYIRKPIKKYSLGMKQKLLLSLYAVSNTQYWFLDEPTLGLDRHSVERLKNYVLAEKNKGRCIFFSAHESEDFFQICDQIYRIEQRGLVDITKEFI